MEKIRYNIARANLISGIGIRNWAKNIEKSHNPSQTESFKSAMIIVPKRDWAAVRKISSLWIISRGHVGKPQEPKGISQREHPYQKGPLIYLA